MIICMLKWIFGNYVNNLSFSLSLSSFLHIDMNASVFSLDACRSMIAMLDVSDSMSHYTPISS